MHWLFLLKIICLDRKTIALYVLKSQDHDFTVFLVRFQNKNTILLNITAQYRFSRLFNKTYFIAVLRRQRRTHQLMLMKCLNCSSLKIVFVEIRDNLKLYYCKLGRNAKNLGCVFLFQPYAKKSTKLRCLEAQGEKKTGCEIFLFG